MDWKEALSSLSGISSLPETEEKAESENKAEKADAISQKGALHVVVEKKGRGGKTATIIEGFEISDDDVAEIARELKKKLGVGGSSRGGEILIQGDRKEEVISFLKKKGLKVKG